MGALSLAALAAAGLSALAGMVHAKGRHVRIIGGLRQPAHGLGPLCRSIIHHDVKIDVRSEGDTADRTDPGNSDGPPTLSASLPPSMESEQVAAAALYAATHLPRKVVAGGGQGWKAVSNKITR